MSKLYYIYSNLCYILKKKNYSSYVFRKRINNFGSPPRTGRIAMRKRNYFWIIFMFIFIKAAHLSLVFAKLRDFWIRNAKFLHRIDRQVSFDASCRFHVYCQHVFIICRWICSTWSMLRALIMPVVAARQINTLIIGRSKTTAYHRLTFGL